ncbi:MAG: hypothetical protein AB1798_23035 [Spirochaetota bacterium]
MGNSLELSIRIHNCGISTTRLQWIGRNNLSIITVVARSQAASVQVQSLLIHLTSVIQTRPSWRQVRGLGGAPTFI